MKGSIKVKRKYAGEYIVLKDGKPAGHITRNGNDRGEWVAYDADGEWISTSSTKWEAVMDFE